MRREITPRHANSTFPAHEEALEMALLPLDLLTQTPPLPLLLRHHSVEASVEAVVEAISSFVAAAVAGEISMIVTCSEENDLLPYRAGRGTRGTFLVNLVNLASHVNRENHAKRREGTKDASKEETRSADQSGPTESAMLTAYGEIHHSLASRTELPMTLLRAVPHIRHPHRT